MHLLIDPLESGRLPVYDFGRPRGYYVWCATGQNQRSPNATARQNWEERRFSPRTLISNEIDEPLTLFVDHFQRRLDALVINPKSLQADEPAYHEEGPLNVSQVPGTLILAIRNCEPWDNFDGWLDSYDGTRVQDRHGVLLLGGMAFCPGVQEGVSMEGQDATYFIEQICLGLAGKEYDRQIGYLRDLIAERLGQRAQFAVQAAEAIARQAEVERKAKKILAEHLNPEQLAEFTTRDQFHVQGGDGCIYLIVNKGQHNIFRIEDGRRTNEYCIVTETRIPTYDQMLAQKLLLEADPTTFHAVTNSWPVVEQDDGKVVRVRTPPPTDFTPEERPLLQEIIAIAERM